MTDVKERKLRSYVSASSTLRRRCIYCGASGSIDAPGETAPRILRVVTLTDGETILNAFFDRRFRKDQP